MSFWFCTTSSHNLGYYTSRPNLKKSVREAEAAQRTAQVFASVAGAHASPLPGPWTGAAGDVALVQHHDAITGWAPGPCDCHFGQRELPFWTKGVSCLGISIASRDPWLLIRKHFSVYISFTSSEPAAKPSLPIMSENSKKRRRVGFML